jgi:hypothetical protein
MDWLAEKQLRDAGRGHLTRDGAAEALNARDLRDVKPQTDSPDTLSIAQVGKSRILDRHIEHRTCSFCGYVAPSYTALVEHHEQSSGHEPA